MINEKIKIFLVDDDDDFLKLLRIELLKEEDFVIETYKTGELCLQHLSLNPDVIILDYNLNSIEKNAMNGIETLDQIKAVNPDVPVIMLSAQDEIEVALNCMNHKAFDYVIKSPTNFSRLKKVIIPFLITNKQNSIDT